MILQSLKRLGRFELTYSIYLPNHIPNTCLRHIRRVSNLVKKNTTWLCDMANIQHESNINPRTLRFYIPSTLGSLWIYTYIYIYLYIYIYRYTCIIYIYTYLYAVLPFPLASSVLRLPANSPWRFPPVLQVWSHEPTFHQNLQCIYAFHVQFTHTHHAVVFSNATIH